MFEICYLAGTIVSRCCVCITVNSDLEIDIINSSCVWRISSKSTHRYKPRLLITDSVTTWFQLQAGSRLAAKFLLLCICYMQSFRSKVWCVMCYLCVFLWVFLSLKACLSLLGMIALFWHRYRTASNNDITPLQLTGWNCVMLGSFAMLYRISGVEDMTLTF
jgi:hypothetical protein